MTLDQSMRKSRQYSMQIVDRVELTVVESSGDEPAMTATLTESVSATLEYPDQETQPGEGT